MKRRAAPLLDAFRQRPHGKILRFKFRPPRGRQPSALADEMRFLADANRVAAAIAADWIEEENRGEKRKPGRPPNRLTLPATLHEAAANYAIARLAECCPECKPDKGKVLRLLRRGRTDWPDGAGNREI